MPKLTSSSFASFFKRESAPGILLFIAAVLAVAVANSPFSNVYDLFINTPVEIRVGALEIAKPLLLWVNDGLMAVFFFLVGLELKRNLIEGELSDVKSIVLPGVGALGGMLVPALVYTAFNYGDEVAMKGWAIPAATDIAFALGVLTLLGSRVPTSMKIFLTSLAIFDDIGAIIIIALFYTSNISLASLGVVALCLPVLFIMNRKGVISKSPYVFVGLIMWVATLKSGVHATLSGVVLAMFIPMRSPSDPQYSPLRDFEEDLHSVVVFVILPLFAFANAGIRLEGMGMEQVLHPVSLGIALGLFIGKQVGVFSFCWLSIKWNLTKLPAGVSWSGLFGVSCLCGIGFTMSLFIGSLAFDKSVIGNAFDERLGIILGSAASGLMGYLILKSRLLPEKKMTACAA